MLLLTSAPAAAEVSGIRAYFAESNVDWNFDTGQREASIREFSFQIEEAIDTGTRLGVGLGYLDVTLRGDENSASRSFNAQYLEFFMRHPIAINDSLELATKFNYRYNTGEDNDEDDLARFDWSEAWFEVGLGIQLSRVRVTPFAVYRYINGDLDAASGVQSFDLDDQLSSGVRLDLFVEKTAYVGIAAESGDYSRFYLVFAREY